MEKFRLIYLLSVSLLLVFVISQANANIFQRTNQNSGNGLTQTRVFDDQGRLTDDNLGSINQRHNTFDANGNLTSRNETGGLTNYTYDALNQLVGELVTNSHSYGYDDNGNRTALNGVSNQYLIGSNRLIQNGTQPVTTDATGQITSIDGYTLQYNGDGRLYRILDTQGAELVRYR